jgi:hypothetical protein
MRRIVLLCVFTLTATAFAASHSEQPPELQKTVDAFLGKWTFDGKLTTPALPAPAPTKMTIDCSKTALDTAVLCQATGESTGVGPMGMGLLIGYSGEEKKVHLMAITAMGEHHDHIGVWKDDSTLSFEPLKFKAGGKESTENLEFHWTSDKAMTFKSTITGADGSEEIFEGSGTR